MTVQRFRLDTTWSWCRVPQDFPYTDVNCKWDTQPPAWQTTSSGVPVTPPGQYSLQQLTQLNTLHTFTDLSQRIPTSQQQPTGATQAAWGTGGASLLLPGPPSCSAAPLWA